MEEYEIFERMRKVMVNVLLECSFENRADYIEACELFFDIKDKLKEMEEKK